MSHGYPGWEKFDVNSLSTNSPKTGAETARPRTIAKENSAAATSTNVDFAVVCQFAGLPVPVGEFKFHPTRKWRFDWAWETQKVALEINGGVFTQGRHTRGAGYSRDMAKMNAAQLLGWRVFQVTPDELLTVGVATIQEALEAK